jgi:hypothetical protein
MILYYSYLYRADTKREADVILRKPLTALMMLMVIVCSPSRPDNVPLDAPWVGSNSEGCFLKIGERVFKGWHMKGWDKKGNMIVEGVWELDGIARAVINTKEITRFDGATFYMEDGAKITRQE